MKDMEGVWRICPQSVICLQTQPRPSQGARTFRPNPDEPEHRQIADVGLLNNGLTGLTDYWADWSYWAY